MTMHKILYAITCLSLVASTCGAKPIVFDFEDKKGVNSITFEMDSLLEPIYGNAAGIAGKVTFNPDLPEQTTGTIVLKASSLHVANKLMNEHMLGKEWMKVADFPLVTFTLERLINVQENGGYYAADAEGRLTILEDTQKISIPVTINYLKGRLAERNRVEGDLLVVRGKFRILRETYNINPGLKLLKVANEIDVRLGLAGAAPYPEDAKKTPENKK